MEEDNDRCIPVTDANCDCVNNTIVVKNVTVLEENMEQLELDDEQSDEISIFQFKSHSENAQIIVSSPMPTSSNRRYKLRPKKLPKTTTCDEYSVTHSSKNDKPLRKNCSLETIFEDPVYGKDGLLMLLGKKKFKRTITFNQFVNKAKTKHRKSKIKRLQKVKVKKPAKVTLDDVKRKLKCLDDSEDEGWMDIKN